MGGGTARQGQQGLHQDNGTGLIRGDFTSFEQRHIAGAPGLDNFR